jgi:hypothetical protein
VHESIKLLGFQVSTTQKANLFSLAKPLHHVPDDGKKLIFIFQVTGIIGGT